MNTLDKWDKRYLSLAKEVATWSKDPSTQVGAVTVGNKKEALTASQEGFMTQMSVITIERQNTNL